MPIPTLQQFTENLEHTDILIDTCFLIDSLVSIKEDPYSSPYAELIKLLRSQGNAFYTILPVEIEFLSGVDLLEYREQRNEFLVDLIEARLPIDKILLEKINEITMLYRKDGKSLSPTDFMLGAALMHYPNLRLLTRDHGDFPVKLFERERVIVLQHPRSGIDTYALFKYSESKGKEIMNQLLKIHEKKVSTTDS